ncbi:flagellar biosynthetic protein FliO [Kineococcus gypseus]|uniref:flagellar biosynthetic protein FliO n=1 Tax=Kineococcus gypseus TaxID=1637102 RepID=UPI003D7CE709
MDALAALLRTSVSLVAVLGLLWLIARWLRRSRAAGAAREGVEVLSRVGVGAKAGVAVVRVGERALVVGVTEQRVTLLTEAPVEELLPEPAPEPEPDREPAAGTTASTAGTPRTTHLPTPRATAVGGSALSPATWSKAVDVLRERTTRR